jgi:hypothetical protein
MEVRRHPSERSDPERSERISGLSAPEPEAADDMWGKHDWHEFFQIASRRWQRRRPPRPVYSTGLNRVLPAVGFSLSELEDAGINIELAERLGLPVDASRVGVYGPNVSALRDFVRSARTPS